MTITFRNPLETPTIIHLHFTGKRQGSICHDERWRIALSLIVYLLINLYAFSSFIPSAEECRHAP